MGQPDGGWYDETPPRVLAESPADGAIDVNSKRVAIYFDEYIKVENPTENIVVSPPQKEAPDINTGGKKIEIKLHDDLKPNTTYTVDFSNSITDNNEGNPLGNYTYTFSTGDIIDTMQVGGYVLDAKDLEPVSGILVGLYDDLSPEAFMTKPMLRVARTNDVGYFSIKGVRNGFYHVFALKDADNNYMFNAKSEAIAFDSTIYETTCGPDIRQDTIWSDSLHIKDIIHTTYTHFYPDEIALRAFTEEQTDRYFLKVDRSKANHFTLFFSYGDSIFPKIKGLNFNADDAFIIEPSVNTDTITYWLKDSALVNQDTLRMTLTYRSTDSTGVLLQQTDTLEVLSREPYARRLKAHQDAFEKWQKKQEKNKKKGRPYETQMAAEALKPEYRVGSSLDPDQNPLIIMPTPLAVADTSKIHLFSKVDTVWHPIPFQFGEVPGRARTYKIIGEWRPGEQYSFEVDSAAFIDIYGNVSRAEKQGFKVPDEEDYNTFPVSVTGFDGRTIVVQLLNSSGNTVKELSTDDGNVTFQWVKPGMYYLRMFVDDNKNGRWDTGDYVKRLQPEAVYYYNEEIERKAKWDDGMTWNPLSRPLFKQKPARLVKQKNTQRKQIRGKNAERAAKLGIPYDPRDIK